MKNVYLNFCCLIISLFICLFISSCSQFKTREDINKGVPKSKTDHLSKGDFDTEMLKADENEAAPSLHEKRTLESDKLRKQNAKNAKLHKENAMQPKETNTKIHVFKSPKGSHVHLKESAMSFESILSGVLPVKKVPIKFHLCKKHLDKESDRIEKAEYLLELENIIEYLSTKESSQKLLDQQEYFLSGVPRCPAFLVELNIISRQLSNFEYLGIAE